MEIQVTPIKLTRQQLYRGLFRNHFRYARLLSFPDGRFGNVLVPEGITIRRDLPRRALRDMAKKAARKDMRQVLRDSRQSPMPAS